MSTENSSTTSTNSTLDQSVTNPASYEVYLKQYVDANLKPKTPAQIRAAGDVKIKLGILWFVGAVCCGLLIIGSIPLINDPKNAKDTWVIIGPILSGVLTGTVAYFTGEKQGNQK